MSSVLKMSRIGKQPITFDNTTKIAVENSLILIKGLKGELKANIPIGLSVDINGNKIYVKPEKNSKALRSIWGLTRSLINNMVVGVNKMFVKNLELIGPGYKALVQNNYLILKIGYSHDIIFCYPKELHLRCPKDNTIEISGCDKQLVGQFASEVREFRKPEPYKGKGIRYVNEVIIRKKGKDSKK
jgi:large subunit ribosomal protein L6